MKKKKKNVDLTEIFDILITGIVQIYVYLMIGIFPLFYKNNFINIVWAKKSFFVYTTIATMAIVILLEILKFIADKKASVKLVVYKTDIFAIIFLAAIVISTINSGDSHEAFWGTSGRQLGGLVMMCCIAAYFLVSRLFKLNQYFIWIFLISGILIFAQEILSNFQIDILGMKTNLTASQHNYFISTMGNININAGFDILFMSFGCALCLVSEKKLSKIMYYVFIFFGMQAMVCSRSDSAFLGMAAMVTIMLIYSMKEISLWKTFLEIMLCAHMGLVALTVMKYLFKYRMYEFEKLQNFITSPQYLAGAIIVITTALVLTMRLKNKVNVDNILKIARRVVIIAVISLIAVAFIIILRVNIDSNYKGIFSGFKITNETGSNRGYIWKRTIEAYNEISFKDKICGVGLNSFSGFIDNYCGVEMREIYTTPFIDAHNEFLQFLVTTGIIGIIGYFGIYLGILIECVKKYRDKINMWNTVAGITLCAYLVQTIPNNPQVFTTPLIFLFIGIIENYNRRISCH